ncbi:MAG: hypothetical protein OJI70_08950 [Zavarzinia sp.]|nr:hypothetical protein [Zavarzinia sp.]
MLRPQADLTAGLRGNWNDSSAQFDRRVKAAFSVGMPVERMFIELQRQEFTRADWSNSIEDEHDAVRREDNLFCKIAAHVYWRADDEHRLTAVRGTYHEVGCL